MVIAQFKYHLHTPSRIMWWLASDLVEEHAFIIPLASKLLQSKCATLHHMLYTDGSDRSNRDVSTSVASTGLRSRITLPVLSCCKDWAFEPNMVQPGVSEWVSCWQWWRPCPEFLTTGDNAMDIYAKRSNIWYDGSRPTLPKISEVSSPGPEIWFFLQTNQ